MRSARVILRVGILAGALTVLPSVVAVGCSTKAAVPPDSPCADGGSIVRLGSFTDEACLAFLEAEERKQVVLDASKAPPWVDPKGSGKLALATPPTFTWAKGILALAPRRWSFSSVAHAHGITNGDGYVLTFRDAAGKELLRVMTTNLGFAPDAATWARLGAGKTLVVSLVGARFSSNVLATGVSPTAGPDLTFTVE